METRTKKKTLVYGIAAVLIVTFAASFIHSFDGSMPVNQTPIENNQNPSNSSTTPITLSSALFPTFASQDALKNYLTINSQIHGAFQYFGPIDRVAVTAMMPGFNFNVALTPAINSATDYSTTNVQVEGVDESDIVKNDGQYVYTISNNSVYILLAYPPSDAKAISKISFDNMYPVGIFVSGNRLAVLGSKYYVPSDYRLGFVTIDIKTFIRVYDIGDRSSPVLLQETVLTGSYFNSRMIGNYVYAVVSQPAYIVYDTVVLPKIYSGGTLMKEVSPSEIHFYNGSDEYYQYTTFVAMNIQNMSEPLTHLTLLLGATSNMYVSLNNIYVTFPTHYDSTNIFRIHVQNNSMTAEAKGIVEGHELNQFSMDESNSTEHTTHFRIATQTSVNGTSSTNLYIMDQDLNVTGKLMNIEPGETMNSARFIENRCYLSTSVTRRDPFFVIDVSNATEPKILGYLRIPGFTSYLHPYDENHIIGIGKDAANQIRIILFDVTDVNSPLNLSEYAFNADWSDSPVLTDHRSLLFSQPKELLALPVSLSYFSQNAYATQQAFFVFDVSLSNGIVLKGNVTHQTTDMISVEPYNSNFIKRGLYIDDFLYTVSEDTVKISDLGNLGLLDEIPLT